MKKLEVRYQVNASEYRVVGVLAEDAHAVYFEYDPIFLADPLWLSPFKLKPQAGLIKHKEAGFGPLFGLFDDSLPDGWGLLLMDRYLKKRKGILPSQISPLARLAFLGSRTMGALTYYPPEEESSSSEELLNLHRLAQESKQVLEGASVELLPELFRLGGSPGGARPKILAGVCGDEIISGEEELPPTYTHWLIKFNGSQDVEDSGIVEFVYSQMAEKAAIVMPKTRLFETQEGDRFFGIERFDRRGNERIHVHSFGNLIHANFRIPSCDYEQLLQVTQLLTKDRQCLLESFRRMVFNIASHNRDDHVKNTAFMFDYHQRQWTLAPAFDLTFSEGPGGEHSMTIDGEGRAPLRKHVLSLAQQFAIDQVDAKDIIEEVCQGVTQWATLAKHADVDKKHRKEIEKRIVSNVRLLAK